MKTSLKTDKNIYCPLLPEDVTFCELDACGDIAPWICYPQDVLTEAFALCDRCKQEMVRDDLAYQPPMQKDLLLDLVMHIALIFIMILFPLVALVVRLVLSLIEWEGVETHE